MKALGACCLLTVIVLAPAPCLAQGKSEPPAVRVALVCPDKSEGIRNVQTLAEAKLSQTPGVQLLERQAIDKVLAEQKLTVSGVVSTDQALAVGKLLSVDLFAILEPGPDKKEVTGLVIFDARTGVRLWDAAMPLGTLEETVTATEGAVRSALQKRGAAAKLRPICLMTVRNADLPRELDVFCDSVGQLLERQFVASPTLGVLERRRLEQVNQERNLPTDSPLHTLLASVVTVDLEVGVSEDRKGLRATASLVNGQGKSLGKITAAVPKKDAADLSKALFKEMAKTLDAKVVPVVGEQAREALRFQAEAEFQLLHGETVRSLRAAESANALQPDDPFARAVLARSLLAHALYLISPASVKPEGVNPKPFTVSSETLGLSLALARRATVLLGYVDSVVVDPKLLFQWDPLVWDLYNGLFNYLPRISEIRQSLTEDEKDALDTLRANLNRSLEARIDHSKKAVADKVSFDKYTLLIFRQLHCNGLHRFLPPSQWVELVCRLETWAEVARKFEDDRAVFSQVLLGEAIQSYALPRAVIQTDVARLQKMWTALENHPHGTVALFGRLGKTVTLVTLGNLSEADTRLQVREFRLFVQTSLEKAGKPAIGLPFNLYLTGTNALSSTTRLKLPGNADEQKELCEFMLQRKDVFPPLILATAENHYSRPKTPEKHRYASEVLQRSLEILDGKEKRFVSNAESATALRAEQDQFRNAALQLQSKIRATTPGIGPAPAAPWEKVTTLLDVSRNTKGIFWVQRPVVHDGAVFAAAFRGVALPSTAAVQLVRLIPGKTDKFEGKLLEISFKLGERGGAAPGTNRNSLAFGSSACIQQGCYYLGTKQDGIFVFPLDGEKPERITTADGLPSDVVQSLVVYEDHLYAWLGEFKKESYLVAWDLKARKCEVLASSRRKEKRSDFDDAAPIIFSNLLLDPARKRVLFLAFSDGNYTPTDGLWTLDPKSNELKHLLPLQLFDQLLYGPNSRVEGDQLLLTGAVGDLTFDLAKKDAKLMFDRKIALRLGEAKGVMRQLGELENYRITKDDFLNVRGPYVAVDGWVWGALPFSRRRVDSSKMELLTPLRTGQPSFSASESLQFYRGDRELLIADSCGIWLITLPKPAEKERPEPRP
jgi:hypothetical protein